MILQSNIGFLLVGHGTRRLAGQQQMRDVHTQFAQAMSPQPTELAFLELAQPSIAEAVRELAKRGVSRLVVVPVLLFAAGHALGDIPLAVSLAARQENISLVGQSAPLASSPAIVQLSALRFRQAVCNTLRQAHCREECEKLYCRQIALAMIGRGSSSASATAQMRRFAEQRREITPVAWLDVGFVYAQRPTVAEVLERLSLSEYSTLVVQPHLLFEGELIDQLRLQVAEFQRKKSNRRWVVTQTLGTDPVLGESLARLALEAAGQAG